MFTITDIQQAISTLGLQPEEYILLMGGSMVVQDYRPTTNDLDIAVTKKAFERLSKGKEIEMAKWTNDRTFEENEMEFFEKETLEDIPSVIQRGVRIQQTDSIIEWKTKGGREKDKQDILLIHNSQ